MDVHAMSHKAVQNLAASIRKEYDEVRREKTKAIRAGREHRHLSDRLAELSWKYRELTGGSI